ncbi:MAG: hypothetical protein MI810_06960 [Flavobacteriales bacterium]|nr:hypothetical protein [Flavobacteriales bacterium]
MTKKDIEKFIETLDKTTYKSIRLKDDNVNPTKELSFKNTGLTYSPTIEIVRNNQTDLYEFEKSYRTAELSKLIAKWIMFSIRAKKLSGKFYLVVNKKDKPKFQQVIIDKQLDVEVIEI